MRASSTRFLTCAVSTLAPVLAFGQPPLPPRPKGEIDPTPAAHVIARLLHPHRPRSLEVDREIAGVPTSRRPELLTWERVYTLALVRARGGPGVRAEALDPKALAEQAARNQVADFDRFRKDLLAARRPGGEGFHDPGGDFLALLGRTEEIDHAQRDVAFYENLVTLFSELIRGEHAGFSRLHLEQVRASLVAARRNLAGEVAAYRDGLERLKVALGLSVRAPVVVDRGIVASFGRVFDEVRGWQERPDRDARELPRIIEGLPAPGEVVVDGRSILALMEGSTDQQEEELTRAAGLAIRNRGDLDKGQRRGDVAAELELDIRSRIRRLAELRRDYESQRRTYKLDIRLLDQGLEQVAAPPPGGGGLARSTTLVSGIVGLLSFETSLRKAEDRLVTTWASFQTERLALYRKLGVLPYNDWKSFFKDLSAP